VKGELDGKEGRYGTEMGNEMKGEGGGRRAFLFYERDGVGLRFGLKKI
jgi:hypothetical protein